MVSSWSWMFYKTVRDISEGYAGVSSLLEKPWIVQKSVNRLVYRITSILCLTAVLNRSTKTLAGLDFRFSSTSKPAGLVLKWFRKGLLISIWSEFLVTMRQESWKNLWWEVQLEERAVTEVSSFFHIASLSSSLLSSLFFSEIHAKHFAMAKTCWWTGPASQVM